MSCDRPPAVTAPTLARACAGGSPTTPQSTSQCLRSEDGAWFTAIEDPATWRRLMTEPPTQAFAQTQVVKFLLDRHAGRRVFFVDTRRWPIHFFFARDVLSTRERPIYDHAEFNRHEYRSPERRFEMGSLVFYPSLNRYSLELIAGDTLSRSDIERLFDDVRRQVHFGDQLAFRPTSPNQVERLVGSAIPMLSSEEVFANLTYQPLTTGIAFGYLRFVQSEDEVLSLSPNDIAVFADAPEELPLTSAIITSALQTPLGHAALLSANRGTPNLAIPGAMENQTLRELDGQLVRLEVTPQSYSVSAAQLPEAEMSWAARRPHDAVDIGADPIQQLLPLTELGLFDTAIFGAKASQLGELTHLSEEASGFSVPLGFAISMGYFFDHLSRARISVRDLSVGSDRSALNVSLSEIRRRIQAAPVANSLIRDVMRRLQILGANQDFIFRSSTNAEDLPGFNGAGLYESVRVSRRATAAEVTDAIRQVWASTFLLRAVIERDWYRIPHHQVGMAIAVQQFVADVTSNGVAITANPFYEGRPAHYVNLLPRGQSVTASTAVPEQHLIYTYTDEPEDELLRSSSQGALLLGERSMRALSSALTGIHRHFVPRWGRANINAVDVEFLLTAREGEVVILQARPFQVRYTEEQRWR